MSRSLPFLLLAALMMMSLSVLAGQDRTEQSGEHQTFSGTLVCLGCDLKKAEGARAQCTDFGHKHALKTEDGKYITFLENKYAADLMKGKHHDQTVEVHGVYFAGANTLDVESFTAGGKKMTWCGHCKAMDACAAR